MKRKSSTACRDGRRRGSRGQSGLRRWGCGARAAQRPGGGTRTTGVGSEEAVPTCGAGSGPDRGRGRGNGGCTGSTCTQSPWMHRSPGPWQLGGHVAGFGQWNVSRAHGSWAEAVKAPGPPSCLPLPQWQPLGVLVPAEQLRDVAMPSAWILSDAVEQSLLSHTDGHGALLLPRAHVSRPSSQRTEWKGRGPAH